MVKQYIGSALFYLCITVLTIVMGIVCFPLIVLPMRVVHLAVKLWARITLWMIKTFCGITYEVEGRENIPDYVAIVASKHQSAWETIFLTYILRIPLFVLKKELLLIPVMGIYIARLFIPIDRVQGQKALTKISKAVQVAKKVQGQVVIFPEGTRTPPGQSIKYNRGVAFIYESLGVPVVPVALNSGLLWGRNSFVKKPGKVRVRFLKPIPAGMDRNEFMEVLHQNIESSSLELSQPA